MTGRHRGRIVGLLLTGATFGGTIGLELAEHRGVPQADLAMESPASFDREAAVGLGSTDQHDRRLHEIVSRPLFSPDRRLVTEAAHGAEGLPRLTAIIVDGPRRLAIFAASPGDRATIVEVGAGIGGYQVRDILADCVTMVGPLGTMVIHPTFNVAPPVSEMVTVPTHPALFNVTAR